MMLCRLWRPWVGAFFVFLGLGASGQEPEPLPPGPPMLEQIVPAPGQTVVELLTIEVQFDRAVKGVDAADLLVNGQPATEVSETILGQFIFTFATPADGPVALAWSPEHGIADGLNQPFAGEPWSYTLNSALPPQLVISEFMASNRRTLRDADGDSEDWIEIHNPGESEVSLEGWFLTSDERVLTQWRFPAVSIPARGYLLVFASEKNRIDPAAGALHTNFKMDDAGQFLALVSPATNLISAFAPRYPRQTTDISYGRDTGEPEQVGFFITPTPGAANTTEGTGFTPAVEFSIPGGLFTTNRFEVALSSPLPGAVIRYTTNAVTPSTTSLLYTGPIRITNSMQIRARAFHEGLWPSEPATESYVILTNLHSFTSTLPVLVIETYGRVPTITTMVAGNVALLEPVRGVAQFSNAPTLNLRAGVKLRGSSTGGLSKSSFLVETWDEFGNPRNVEMAGLPEESDWVLYAPNIYDPIMIHNPFIHELSRQMGMYSSRTRFVEVFYQNRHGIISSNQYFGVYVLEEKIKIDKNRVDIEELDPEDLKPPAVTGGYLMKIDRTGPGESGFPGGGTTVIYVDPEERQMRLPARDPQEQYIRNYFAAFGRALASANWRDPVAGYPAFIDIPSWIDFHVLEVLSGNVDAMVLSTYFHKPRNGKITFGPHWDFDRALGSTDGRDSNPRLWNTGPFFGTAWWSRLFTDRDFWQKWVDRWQDLRQNLFAKPHLNQLIDRFTDELREAQPRENRRWRVPLRGGGYQGEIDLMKNWLSNRIDFIDRQMTQPPVLSRGAGLVPAGTLVELQAAAGATIFYTLDGSDPRASQGEPTASALTYTGPIRVDANVRLMARARDLTKRQTGGPPASTPWSGPVTASYYLTTPKLLLTEIMYHPATTAADLFEDSEYEFMELLNPGSEAMDLTGFTLSGGVSYAFNAASSLARLEPGQRLLLVKNRDAFVSRYPNSALAVAGQYTNALGDAGDRIILRGALGEPVFEVAYEESWGRMADGLGFSLVLTDEAATAPEQLGDRSRWRVSTQAGGSPGAADAPAFRGAVKISEALSNARNNGPDLIELHNASNLPADISGWFLTDDFQEPRKYRFPEGTTIGPWGFMVVSAAQFDDASSPTAFGLGAAGDAAYIFAADALGNLLGYYHGFAFGAAEPGLSYGLFVTSDGKEHFVPQTEASFGFPNNYPRVGPVVIGEIVYQPPAELLYAEFVELQNISPEPVLLFDPLEPARTWQLRGGIEFDLPPNTVLPPYGRLVIAGFNPANAFMRSPFLSRFGVDPGTALLGPWTGTLANEGETVELLRPRSASGTTAGSGWISVDRVSYRPAAPWPDAASNPGRAIVRIAWNFFSNEPEKWTAQWPTPGDLDFDGDGLADSWETAQGLNPRQGTGADGFTGDPDGDGFSNYEELLAGTSPRQAESSLALIPAILSAQEVSITFQPVAGRTYTVEFSDSVAAENWRLLRTFTAVGSAPIVVRDKPVGPRFYRVRVP